MLPTSSDTPHTTAERTRYLNRELSLLAFQERVLALGEDPETPLLERVKYLAIVSQNLDEFFQVRVAGLQEQVRSGVSTPSPDGMSPAAQLAAIRPLVEGLLERMDDLFVDTLLPALDAHGIHFVTWADLDETDKRDLSTVFEEEVFPVLTPLAVDPSHPFPYISDLSLNLAVRLRPHQEGALQFARIKVPPILSRFVALPDGERFLPLEELIAAHLNRLFGGREVVDHYMFRVTRNADLAVEEEEADDLLEAMETVLRFRQRSAQPARLEAECDMPDEVLDLLRHELKLSQQTVYRTRAPLSLGTLWSIWALDRPEIKDPPWSPVTQTRLAAPANEEVDFFRQINRGDILVHHPYESFASSTGAFLAQAAHDPDVLAIKQTLYRTSVPEDPAIGGEEAVVRSLMAAAQLGKQVVVLVELKARFDEEANITWARMLEDAGVHVVYGVADLKTHSKALLVVRREHGRLRRYAHLGTGNYNPKTARIYEDVGLFTADADIGADLSELFNSLTGYAQSPTYRKLIVAPHAMRNRLIDRIREEATLGSRGRIAFKINHLVDPEIIDELYAASERGCQVDLVVRGICALRAGVPGLSDNIRVRSIVGEFLEHSRVYRFGDPTTGAVYYMGSADLMQRNLNRRVETLVPVTDPMLRHRLEEMIQVNLADDTLAWSMQPDSSWTKVPNIKGVNTHQRLKELALGRSRTRGNE